MMSIQKRTIEAMGWLVPALFLLFPLNMALSNLTLLMVLLGFAVTWDSCYLERHAWGWPAVFLIALFAMVLIGVFYSPASWSWILLNVKKYARFVYAVALMSLFFRFPEWQPGALRAFVAAMFFILASTWLNVWFVLPWSVTQMPGWGLSHHVFGDYITQNVMMSFFVVFALSKIKGPWLDRYALFWTVTAILGALSVTHLSSGRTGVFLLLAGLLSFMLVRWGGKKLWLGLPVLVLLIVGALASSSVMRDRMAQGWKEFVQRDVDVMTSIGHRAYNYRIVPKMIAEKPIMGHGTGAYHTEICRFIDKPEWCDIFRWHSHNQFLFFGADHGLIGVLLYVALLISLYRVAWHSEQIQGQVLLVALTSILVVDSMINTPLFSSIESQFFLYMMALLVMMNRSSGVHSREPLRRMA